MIILALEASSTSSKAMLYDTNAGVIKVETRPFPSAIDDLISQDTEGVFFELIKLSQGICKGHKIDAIALGGTWHNVAVLDHNMTPVTRTHSWLDTSAATVTARLRLDPEFTKNYYENCGCMVHTTYAPFKLMHMRENGLDLSDKFIIDQGSYTFYRLTGKRVCTASMASGMGLLNIHNLKYDAGALNIAGINANQLGDLGTYQDFGYLTEATAKEIGLPSGIPVIPAFPDGALNQMGAGAMGLGVMTLSVGTSAAMRMISDKPVTSEDLSTWCYISAKNTWLSGAATAGSCNCIDWVKRQLLRDAYNYAQLEDSTTYMANLPFFLPFIYGERCPGWNDERRGGYHDIKPAHGPSDFFISAMEGILFNIKQCYDILVSLNERPDKIMVSGGILKSPMWVQMLSDILGRDIYRTDMEQASLMGGVYVTGAALGGETALKCEMEEIVLPGSAVEMYGKRYERYMELYLSTK